jgi:hypothetical protein
MFMKYQLTRNSMEILCKLSWWMQRAKQAAPTCLTHHTFCLSTCTIGPRGHTITQQTNVVKETKAACIFYLLHSSLFRQASLWAKKPDSIAIIAWLVTMPALGVLRLGAYITNHLGGRMTWPHPRSSAVGTCWANPVTGLSLCTSQSNLKEQPQHQKLQMVWARLVRPHAW